MTVKRWSLWSKFLNLYRLGGQSHSYSLELCSHFVGLRMDRTSFTATPKIGGEARFHSLLRYPGCTLPFVQSQDQCPLHPSICLRSILFYLRARFFGSEAFSLIIVSYQHLFLPPFLWLPSSSTSSASFCFSSSRLACPWRFRAIGLTPMRL